MKSGSAHDLFGRKFPAPTFGNPATETWNSGFFDSNELLERSLPIENHQEALRSTIIGCWILGLLSVFLHAIAIYFCCVRF